MKKGLHGLTTDEDGTQLHIVDEYNQEELAHVADGLGDGTTKEQFDRRKSTYLDLL